MLSLDKKWLNLAEKDSAPFMIDNKMPKGLIHGEVDFTWECKLEKLDYSGNQDDSTR